MEKMMKRTMMTGTKSFADLYHNQIRFQENVLHTCSEDLRAALPVDSTHWFSYHMQAMLEELGEVLKADKRWKTHRNERYEPDEKKDEIADVFITAMNLSIFSGYNYNELFEAIEKKILENNSKLDNERRQ